MKKFCLFEIHEYMDMYPSKEVRVIEGDDEMAIKTKCIDWAAKMSLAYSGGPTHFVKIMTKDEVADFMASEFKKCLMNTGWPDDMNIEDALKVTSENNIRLFFECYGRDKNK